MFLEFSDLMTSGQESCKGSKTQKRTPTFLASWRTPWPSKALWCKKCWPIGVCLAPRTGVKPRNCFSWFPWMSATVRSMRKKRCNTWRNNDDAWFGGLVLFCCAVGLVFHVLAWKFVLISLSHRLSLRTVFLLMCLFLWPRSSRPFLFAGVLRPKTGAKSGTCPQKASQNSRKLEVKSWDHVEFCVVFVQTSVDASLGPNRCWFLIPDPVRMGSWCKQQICKISIRDPRNIFEEQNVLPWSVFDIIVMRVPDVK